MACDARTRGTASRPDTSPSLARYSSDCQSPGRLVLLAISRLNDTALAFNSGVPLVQDLLARLSSANGYTRTNINTCIPTPKQIWTRSPQIRKLTVTASHPWCGKMTTNGKTASPYNQARPHTELRVWPAQHQPPVATTPSTASPYREFRVKPLREPASD